MDSALVVLTSEEADDQLLAAAKQFVTGTDTELVVCRFIDEDKYQSNLQRKAESGGDTPSIDELEVSAREKATEVAEMAFGDDVPYTSLGVVGDLPGHVFRIADEHGCDHVFITGKERSPTGKALFSDIAQSVIINFDGPVTVTTRSSE